MWRKKIHPVCLPCVHAPACYPESYPIQDNMYRNSSYFLTSIPPPSPFPVQGFPKSPLFTTAARELLLSSFAVFPAQARFRSPWLSFLSFLSLSLSHTTPSPIRRHKRRPLRGVRAEANEVDYRTAIHPFSHQASPLFPLSRSFSPHGGGGSPAFSLSLSAAIISFGVHFHFVCRQFF
jgi:hypothetical protein